MRIFLLLFIVLPIVELTVLIKVGTIIGALNTIALIFITTIAGAVLLRRQGLNTLLKAQQRLNSGELPAQEVAEGMILAVGGALLLVPGFVTDVVGVLCLLPGVRQWLARQALKRMVVAGNTSAFYSQSQFRDPFGQDGDVIEGEYQDETQRHQHSLNKSDDKSKD